MKKSMFYLINFVVISAKLTAMCPEKNKENAKNLRSNMYNIADLQMPSTDFSEQSLSEFINFEAFDGNDRDQVPNALTENSNFSLSNCSTYPSQHTNISYTFTPTSLPQFTYTNLGDSKQEWSDYFVHHILTSGNNNMRAILKNYLLKVEDIEKQKKELDIQLIEAKKDFIQNVHSEMLKNDTSSAINAVDTPNSCVIQDHQSNLSAGNAVGTSNGRENTRKRKSSSAEINDSTSGQSAILDNPQKRPSKKIDNRSVYLLPIDEIVYSRNKVTSYWATFFSKPENLELNKSQINEENEKSEYKTKEIFGLRSYVSNWNNLSKKKKTTFNKALKKRREEIEQKNAEGKIVNIFEDDDVRKDFFASEEIKNLINSGNIEKNENSSISDDRFRMIIRLILGQKPKDVWDAEYKGYPDEVLRKYMLVGVVLSDINNGYEPNR